MDGACEEVASKRVKVGSHKSIPSLAAVSHSTIARRRGIKPVPCDRVPRKHVRTVPYVDPPSRGSYDRTSSKDDLDLLDRASLNRKSRGNTKVHSAWRRRGTLTPSIITT